MVTISQGERFAIRIQGDDMDTARKYRCYLLNKAEGKRFAEDTPARLPSTDGGMPVISAYWSPKNTKGFPLGVLALDIKSMTENEEARSIYFVEKFAVVRSSCETLEGK